MELKHAATLINSFRRTPDLIAHAPQSRRAAIIAALAVYARPRVLIVLLLGFSAGLPLALSGETLRVWMADRGVDLATIGLLSLAGLPYTIKFLWAPIVDALPVPWLSARLGRRRGWLVASQLTLIAMIVLLGTRDPLSAPLVIGLCALLVAFASATQDIVIDAYRVEILPIEEQAAGMASYVAAYRVGMLVSGAGVIALAAWLESIGVGSASVWPIAYMAAAVMGAVGLIAVLIAPEPASTAAEPAAGEGSDALARVWRAADGAFREFLSHKAAVPVLAFVLLYKLCDALAGGFAGGAVARVLPLATALWLGVLLQMASNLVFVWLGWQAPSAWALSAAILVENFTGALGTVIFVAYLSALCRNPLHTATQYALLTALASAGRTVLSAGSGIAVNAIGWSAFFVATALAALPALALLVWLQRRHHFSTLAADP